jgi:prepilin-type processing-associated H-X9-DG protein
VEWDNTEYPNVPAVSKLTGIQVPTDTIYLADDEYDPTRAFVTTNSANIQLYDVWTPTHLPFSGRVLNPLGFPLGRRVSLNRHGKGPALLWFDGHAQTKDAHKITVYDWRDRKY